MKKFRKAIATLLLVVSFATLLVGCTKNTTCDICGEEGKCKKTKFMGEKVWACEDCRDELEALGKLFG